MIIIDEQNKKHMKWLKDYLYQLYKDEVITSDELYNISEIFSIKNDYDYSRHRKEVNNVN